MTRFKFQRKEGDKMRIAICDDELCVLDEVTLYINKYCNQSGKTSIEVFPFNSAGALINSIDNGEVFDIFLLEI